MDQNQAKKLLGAFLDLASSTMGQATQQPSSPFQFNFLVPVSSYGRDKSVKISLQGWDSHNQISNFSEAFWDIDREIRQTVSTKLVQEKVINLLIQYQQDESSITTTSLRQVLDELLRLPNKEWLVLRPVYGASLGHSNLIHLGPFTLYKWDAYQSLVASKDTSILVSCLRHAHESKELDESCLSCFSMLENLGNIFISVQVKARDSDRALELANERFSQFENAISYMLGCESRNFIFGITDHFGVNMLENLLIAPGNVSYSSVFQDNLFPLQFDHPFFCGDEINFGGTEQYQYWAELGHDWIWKTLKLESSQLTRWQKRILDSIDWMGKGLRDKNYARALVQFTFALESLFSYNEKGVLVSPSIASTLAEFTAFTIGENISERMSVIRQVKEIYNSRSAVVHGGTQVISVSILSDALRLMKNVITKIITDPELQKLQSIDQVKDWINNRKYS